MNYIGFDLGDGESSLALLEEGKKDAKVILMDGKESFPTAVGTLKDGHRNIIGYNAIINEANSDNFRVNFKQYFTDKNADTYDCYYRFISAILGILREKIAGDIANNKKYRFVIGHPAGWSDEMIAQYRELLEECSIANPLLVSESRAALVYYASSFILDPASSEKFKSSILICDFGSSTLDFAYMPNGVTDDIQTLGHKRLGGGLIDKQIVHASIQNIADPIERKKCEDAINRDRNIYSLVLYRARQLKEKYFTADDITAEFSKNVFVGRGGIESVNITVNKKIIDSCLNTPIQECDNKSFTYALESTLKEVFYKIGSKPADFVILTGGSSRMAFFRQMCIDELENPHPLFSLSPETDIAKGLALDGDYKTRLMLLKADVDNFLRTTTKNKNRISSIVSFRLPDFINTFAKKASQDILSKDNTESANHIASIVDNWKDSGRTLVELNDRLNTGVSDYFSSTHFENLFSSELEAWFNDCILPDIQKELNGLCEKHKISANKVRLEGNMKVQIPNFNNIKIINSSLLSSAIRKLFGFMSKISINKLARRSKAKKIYSYTNQIKIAHELSKSLNSSQSLKGDIQSTCEQCLVKSISALEYEVKI